MTGLNYLSCDKSINPTSLKYSSSLFSRFLFLFSPFCSFPFHAHFSLLFYRDFSLALNHKTKLLLGNSIPDIFMSFQLILWAEKNLERAFFHTFLKVLLKMCCFFNVGAVSSKNNWSLTSIVVCCSASILKSCQASNVTV